jgi:long-chain acyl-CoA synthetase
VRDFAHGLAQLGVRPGDVVAILGDNRPEWLISELGAQSLGACVVGIYPTSVGEEIVHILSHARVRVVVAEDQEQVDKLIRLWDRLDSVKAVIYYDPRGLEHYQQDYLLEFTAVEARGREYEQTHPGWLDEQIAAGRASDIAVICTTSGTTARPKLAMLSHRNLLSMGSSLMAIDPLDADDRYVSFLPFAWIGEQMLTLACGLQAGFTVSFPEEANTVRADLREIGPNVMFSPPRIWEDMLSSVQVRVGEAGWLKRAAFAWGHRVGGRVADRRVNGCVRSTGCSARSPI